MGVDDCVAADKTHYVELALRVARDPEYRQTVRTKILAAADRFFNDRSAIRELEEFLEHAARGMAPTQPREESPGDALSSPA